MNQKKIYFSILFCLLFSYSQAAIIYVDINAQGNNDGSTWLDAYQSLDTALVNASNGDAIRVAEGVYVAPSGGFVLKDGIKIYGGYLSATLKGYTPSNQWLATSSRFNNNATTTIGGSPCFLVNQDLWETTVIDGLVLENTNTSTMYISNVIELKTGSLVQFHPLINNCRFTSTQTSHVIGIGQDNYFNDYMGTFAPFISNSTFDTNYGINIKFGSTYHYIDTDIINTKFSASKSVSGSAMSFTSTSNSPTANVRIDNSSFKYRIGLELNMDISVEVSNSIFGNKAGANKNLPFRVNNGSTDILVASCTFYGYEIISQDFSNTNNLHSYRNCVFGENGKSNIFTVSGIYDIDDCLFNISTHPTSHHNAIVHFTNTLFGQNPNFLSTDPASKNYLKLSANSPARNSGNNAYATGKSYDGNKRVLEERVDIGAFEFCPSNNTCNSISTGGGGGPTFPKIAVSNELSQSDLIIYPNPVKDVVNFKSNSKILVIEVLNVQGQLVGSTKNSNTLILNDIAKGVYLLKVTTEKGLQTKRIVKE